MKRRFTSTLKAIGQILTSIDSRGAVILLSLILLSAGFYSVYKPAALIVPGLLLFLLAVVPPLILLNRSK